MRHLGGEARDGRAAKLMRCRCSLGPVAVIVELVLR